ncbi:hypothetical protein FGADI_5719 [Fusarium gaditjirri]|uniref:Uncharacterized protein n=1 Tax=Fusarium gaditjirri TaxID=282569 RepID=A0A8H4WXE2_9HYPO|nr:hypothetical protein FGADI_5719 [Fusarium gaditjirri]
MIDPPVGPSCNCSKVVFLSQPDAEVSDLSVHTDTDPEDQDHTDTDPDGFDRTDMNTPHDSKDLMDTDSLHVETPVDIEDRTSRMGTPLRQLSCTGRTLKPQSSPLHHQACPRITYHENHRRMIERHPTAERYDSVTYPSVFDSIEDSPIQDMLLGLWYTNAKNANITGTRHIAFKVYKEARGSSDGNFNNKASSTKFFKASKCIR